jgi:hypothetical protein
MKWWILTGLWWFLSSWLHEANCIRVAGYRHDIELGPGHSHLISQLRWSLEESERYGMQHIFSAFWQGVDSCKLMWNSLKGEIQMDPNGSKFNIFFQIESHVQVVESLCSPRWGSWSATPRELVAVRELTPRRVGELGTAATPMTR